MILIGSAGEGALGGAAADDPACARTEQRQLNQQAVAISNFTAES
jgi:hypothetical protein